MVALCVAVIPGRPPTRATLSTEHSQSSYGVPVVVLDDVAYGSAEVLWIDCAPEHREAARRAGYKALSAHDTRWPHGYKLSSQGLSRLTCRRCSHRWTPRKERVHVCPKCKSPRWREP